MINPIFNLPPIRFIGGETKNLRFNLVTKSGDPFDATGCDVSISIIDFNNPNGKYILDISCDVKSDDMGKSSIVATTLSSHDTVSLNGRYIYQLSIKNDFGVVEIPGQGIMDIIKNIHPDFIIH